ncbi:MAG: NAD(P)/FAD-dependent oxidoreductase [Planctomycetota bacterium]
MFGAASACRRGSAAVLEGQKRIAIVGSGIAGLVAAWILCRKHAVTLFEADDRIGGHTNTIEFDLAGERHAIDTGFIVYNERTYPNFTRLLDRLGVVTQPSDMSFSVKCERTGLEYNGHTLNTLFAQRSNLFRPRFWRMIRDILRFNREAVALLDKPEDETTLGTFLLQGGYSEAFLRHYILPMGAAIWSTTEDRMLGFPAHFFARFFHNHGFLSVDDRPEWRVIANGSRRYVEKLIVPFADRIRVAAPVVAIERRPDGVSVAVRGGSAESFDEVVIASHSDQALRMLADPSDAERAILGAIPYQENVAILHTDERLLPRRRLARAAWNYHLPVGDSAARVSLTYDMNVLQSLRTKRRFLVTLNREDAVDPSHVHRRIVYHHPLFTREGVAAQRRHGEISGVRRTHYCGAYWRYGFHEDGVVSALAVAKQFGMELT